MARSAQKFKQRQSGASKAAHTQAKPRILDFVAASRAASATLLPWTPVHPLTTLDHLDFYKAFQLPGTRSLACKRPVIGRGQATPAGLSCGWLSLLLPSEVAHWRGRKLGLALTGVANLRGHTLSLPLVLQLTARLWVGENRLAYGAYAGESCGFCLSPSLLCLHSPCPVQACVDPGLVLPYPYSPSHHPFPPPPPFTLYTGRRANSERRCAPSASWYPCHWCRPASGEVSELKRSMLMGGSGKGMTEARRRRVPPCHGHAGCAVWVYA